ncbi:hypothetical protein AcW1_010188 [Taiwanofungus camphoratus]|nr:hypothetical protein AcV5_003076 [Antrodia cinnamomea]KAI0946848.1 hypothetical protein AcW1_010188 [Antrodia cinnamomea]KAI0954353.1 hypothetical protein AcV7_007612 [Antrodia cinnamomea]
MRQAGMSINYMNDNTVRGAFIAVANQVTQDWVNFFQQYNAAAAQANMGNYQVNNIAQIHRNWINANLVAYGNQAQTFLTTAQDVLTNMLNNGQLTIGVPLPGSPNTATINTANLFSYGNINWQY